MSCPYTLFLHVSLLQVLPILCQTLTGSQRGQILTIHNTIRKNIAQGHHGPSISNMNKLIWSDSLEHQAGETVACTRQRLSTDDTVLMPMVNFGKYRRLDISKILTFWLRESRYFVQEESMCIPWERCSRYRAMMMYLQMAGADRERVGCALKTCPRRRNSFAYALVCLYDGGDPDSFRYKTGPVCTRCKDSRPFCNNSMCVTCSQSENRTCECAKTCERENIGSGVLNRTSCTCSCASGLGPNCDEECKNPEIYADYDFCATVSRSDCNEPDVYMSDLIKESCPEQCVCRRHPNQE